MNPHPGHSSFHKAHSLTHTQNKHLVATVEIAIFVSNLRMDFFLLYLKVSKLHKKNRIRNKKRPTSEKPKSMN